MASRFCLLVFCIELDESCQSPLTDRTELGFFVGAHPAVVTGTIDSFRQVTATLEEAYTWVCSNHILPFAVEIE